MGKEDEQYQNLIPGLPDEIAFDCLLRLPYCYHSPLKSVCRKWKSLLSRHSFYAQRRLAAKGEDFVCLVQALVAPDSQQPKQTHGKTQNPLLYGLTLYNATHDTWRRLPETPLLPDGIPMFSQCVAVAGKLVVVGGWHPSTLDSVADVYVYDFVGGGGWARGASLSTARSFFACAAVGPFVFVAGGHDNQKNALKSAELYDPNTDTWQPLPDMAEERDECHGFPSGDGRFFWVMSGYGTDSQGQFSSSAEFYDSARGEWTRVDGVWPYPNRGPGASTCLPPRENRKHEMTEVPFPGLWCVDVGGDVGGHARGVREYDIREAQWKLVGPIPEGTRSSPCVALIEGAGSPSDRIFVIGSGYMDGADMKHVAYLWDTLSKGWTHIDAPVGFSGFVFSACSIHL